MSILSRLFENDQFNADILLEAISQYHSMFQNIIAEIEKNDPERANKIKKDINAVISDTKKSLKRNDRIVWFLRYYRAYIALLMLKNELISQDTFEQNKKALKLTSYSSFENYMPIAFSNYKPLLAEIEHFLSLDIHAINTFVFQNQGIDEIKNFMFDTEEEWKNSRTRSFKADKKDRKLIKFPGNWAWWLLDRPSCSEEARAMGHCGNSAAGVEGERILSLRQSEIVPSQYDGEDEERVTPYLTFILDADGQLGEMKGRGNDKPAKRYHPYIVALLRHKIVSGIKGGGYMAENNFRMSDLEPEVAEKLVEQKPALAGLEHIVKKFGPESKEVLDYIYNYLVAHNLDTPSYPSIEDSSYVLQEWSDLSHALREFGDDVVSDFIKTYENDSSPILTFADISSSDLQFIVENLKEPALKKVANSMGLRYRDDNSINRSTMINQIIFNINGSILKRAIDSVISSENYTKELLLDRIRAYIDVGWYFVVGNVWLDVPESKDDSFLSQSVKLKIAIQDMINAVMQHQEGGDDDGGDDDGGDLWKARTSNYSDDSGWEAVEWEYVKEKRGPYEEGLTDKNGKDLVLGNLDGIESALDDVGLFAERVSDVLLGLSNETPTIDDPNQMKLDI